MNKKIKIDNTMSQFMSINIKGIEYNCLDCGLISNVSVSNPMMNITVSSTYYETLNIEADILKYKDLFCEKCYRHNIKEDNVLNEDTADIMRQYILMMVDLNRYFWLTNSETLVSSIEEIPKHKISSLNYPLFIQLTNSINFTKAKKDKRVKVISQFLDKFSSLELMDNLIVKHMNMDNYYSLNERYVKFRITRAYLYEVFYDYVQAFENKYLVNELNTRSLIPLSEDNSLFIAPAEGTKKQLFYKINNVKDSFDQYVGSFRNEITEFLNREEVYKVILNKF